MYRIRRHSIDRDEQKRQKHELIDITANGVHIPLQRKWIDYWCTLPNNFEHHFKSIYEFDIRQDDVFVVTHPKCGTTWIQEATWLLLNNLDYELAQKEFLIDRSIFIDFTGLYGDIPTKISTVQSAAQLKSPRLIKTHLPAHLIPMQIWEKNIKIIYTARNPKDVVVSYYHFLKGLGTWFGSLQEFVDAFINDHIMYSPYWRHVVDFWQMRHQSNIFFVTYEEMKTDLAGVLKRLCEFLEIPALNDEQMQKLLEHLSFENMKENKATNLSNIGKTDGPFALPEFKFMRRGIDGSYKDELTAKDQLKLEQWTEKCLNQTGISQEDIFGKLR